MVSPKIRGLFEEAARRGAVDADGKPKPKKLTANALPGNPPEPKPSTPLVKQWWFWTAVGVVAVGAGAAFVASQPPSVQPGNLGVGELR
jgi:hypothetical protein